MCSGNSCHFDYNLIKVMNEVISSGNLSRAAKRLGMTISAVSLAITKLQRQLGVELFIRTSQGMKPTVVALEIHKNFLHAASIIDGAVLTARYPMKNYASLNIICSDMLEGYYFQHLFQQEAFCDTQFSFCNSSKRNHDEYVEDLLKPLNDIVLSTFPLRHNQIISVRIDILEEFVVIFSQNNLLASLGTFTTGHYYNLPQAVYNYSGISPDNSIPTRDIKESMVKIGYCSSSLDGVICTVERREMVAILPKKISEYYIAARKSKLLTLPLPGDIMREQIAIYASYKKQRDSQYSMSEVVEYLISLSACQ